MNELELIKSKEFDGYTLDCYVEPNQQDKGAFWATRTQIGQLLGYSEPGTAIKNIHMRNKERLDRFSRVAQIELPSGGTQDVTVYNFMGLLEICRYSQQDTANQVIDTLWAIAEEIRRTGSYNAKPVAPDASDYQWQQLNLERAKFLQHMIDAPAFPLTDESKAVIAHEAFKILTGHEYLGMLPACTEQWYTASDIGEILGISANKVGRIANEYGLKPPVGESNQYGRWIFSKSKHSPREVPSFVYTKAGFDWFMDYRDGVCREA